MDPLTAAVLALLLLFAATPGNSLLYALSRAAAYVTEDNIKKLALILVALKHAVVDAATLLYLILYLIHVSKGMF